MNKKIKSGLIAGTFLCLFLVITEILLAVTCKDDVTCLVFLLLPFYPIGSLLQSIGINNTGFPLIISSFIFYFIIGYIGGLIFYRIKKK